MDEYVGCCAGQQDAAKAGGEVGGETDLQAGGYPRPAGVVGPEAALHQLPPLLGHGGGV